jgi:hypothetical protein
MDLVDFHKQENSGRHYLHIQATIDLLALGLMANPSAMGLLAEELEDCSSRVRVSPLRCLACLQSSADGASAVMHLAAVVAGQPYARALGAMVARHPSGGTVLKLVAGGARTLRPCPVRKRRRRGRRRCRRDARGRANEDKVPHRSELEGNKKRLK